MLRDVLGEETLVTAISYNIGGITIVRRGLLSGQINTYQMLLIKYLLYILYFS